MATPSNPSSAYSSSATNIETLKELFSDDGWVMKNLVLNRNPALAMINKDESPSGLAGK